MNAYTPYAMSSVKCYMNSNKEEIISESNDMEVFMMKVLRNGMSSLMDGDEGGSLYLVYDSECSYKS